MTSASHIVKKLRENRILNERTDYSKKSRDELIQLAQDGDQLALEMLINSHQDMIINYSKKYNLDTGDFDDIKQYVTIAFWEAVRDWDMTGNFEAYAGMRIKRKMADVLRSEDTEKTKINTKAAELDAPVGTDDEGGELSLGASLASSNLSLDDEVIGKEGARDLMKFMRDKFSASEREAIMMYMQGYKVSEIAEETGMKYKSVENALMRVKNKLTDYLRSRESKIVREGKVIEFSDTEKKLVENVINKLNSEESALKKLRESYEEYSESQLEDELYDIESSIEEIVQELRVTDNDDRDDLYDSLEELSRKLLSLEDYLPDDLRDKCDSLKRDVDNAYSTEYEPIDWDHERELKRDEELFGY